MKKIWLLFIIILIFKAADAQFIPENTGNEGIYSFIDEMATEGWISINSAVKPYSRQMIYQGLVKARESMDQMNKRQKKELEFYLKSFRYEGSASDSLSKASSTDLLKKSKSWSTGLTPFGVHYKDALFTVTGKPIYNIEYLSNANGTVTHTRGGVEVNAAIAGQWGIYASLRDNHENELLSRPGYFTLREGGAFKENNGGREGGDYSEFRGGITYAWKWGDVGIVKDQIVWGNNLHGSNILSGKAPSFAHLRLHLNPVKWLDFNYFHGWLVSEVIDSTRSQFNTNQRRTVFSQKFMAANLITITPFKKLKVSLGNSIVYSDLGGVHPAYLIPLAFYKSIDHTLNHAIDNQNSQMFLDISARVIPKLHLSGSVYVDEFSITRLSSKESHNFISWKGSASVYNFPLENLSFFAEFTQTTPITYKHYIPTITFESSKYGLGHYLMDNSREIYLSVGYRPVSRLYLSVSYTMAEHGNDYTYEPRNDITELPMLEENCWQSKELTTKASYQFFNTAYIFIEFGQRNVEGFDLDGQTAQYYLDKFTPAFFQGETQTISTGFFLGF
ncbi:MAG: hypothetical protein IPH84_06760 [Bacteroidales bacterium]|nr:hypothetical protein [Bacteroidales bacterium]